MDPFGVVGIAISLAIAYWQHRKAEAAENKHAALLDSQQKLLEDLPSQLLGNISRLLSIETEDASEQGHFAEVASPGDLSYSAQYADLDGDGREELLVQFPLGHHGSALQIYGMRDWNFELITETRTDTPWGFHVEDRDGDGRLEIHSVETSSASSLPYVAGLRDAVWHRLEDDELVEIAREQPTPEEIAEAETELNSRP